MTKFKQAVGIALDPNTSETGVVIFDGEYRPIGHITISAGGLHDMMGKVTLFIMSHEMTLTWVAVEDVYHGPNARNTINLAKLIGAICSVAIPHRRYFEFSTSEINAALKLPARLPSKERKKALMELARKDLGEDINQHEADAWGVGICALLKLSELDSAGN